MKKNDDEGDTDDGDEVNEIKVFFFSSTML